MTFRVDIGQAQHNFGDQRVCGDTILCRQISEAERTLIVLSDGLGHGAKANVLSKLTCKMLYDLASEGRDAASIPEILLDTLPLYDIHKINYATFSFVDINHLSATISIMEYDNPLNIVFRGSDLLELSWEHRIIESDMRPQTILSAQFRAEVGDRIVLVSDGVVQSGQGSKAYPFGWGRENLVRHLSDQIARDPHIKSEELTMTVVRQALDNDMADPKDDASCVVIRFI